MGFSTSTCTEFVEVLASKAPVPGGGGASALVGAVGTALGNMVGRLTVGNKKYAEVEDEMWELKKKCDELQKDFLRLIERDAEGKLCGDVDFEKAEPIVEAITPVPGGVGSVTTSVLVGHVVEAAKRKFA